MYNSTPWLIAMNVVVDTSIIVSVITNEEHKQQIIKITKGTDLIAPLSLHWEIGNAFSAMFKQKRITVDQALTALSAYKKIPIHFVDVDLELALKLANNLNIYAYDAYFLECALNYNCPLLSLDQGLVEAAHKAGIKVKEVSK